MIDEIYSFSSFFFTNNNMFKHIYLKQEKRVKAQATITNILLYIHMYE
jgi:hypothetical protein